MNAKRVRGFVWCLLLVGMYTNWGVLPAQSQQVEPVLDRPVVEPLPPILLLQFGDPFAQPEVLLQAAPQPVPRPDDRPKIAPRPRKRPTVPNRPPNGFRPRSRPKPKSATSPAKKSAVDNTQDVVTTKKFVPPPPRFMRLHLMDDSVISGKLSVDEITVETEFGKLTVPISKISSITPGLNSHPQVSEKINGLIKDLGSADYRTREQANKDLIKMGLMVRKILQQHKADENAERKRHIQLILTALEELVDEQDEFEGGQNQELVPYDVVVTSKFTIVGKISPSMFKISSKYGPLNVKLSDIRSGERNLGLKQTIRKSLSVAGTHLLQRSVLSSGIRVARGDKVSVSANGQITMTPWGSNALSSPVGTPNYGWYIPNKIPVGALVARIGTTGEVVKIGDRHTFVAKKSGVLYFAIAMMAQYANQNYNYPGQYTVRVKVEPQ